MVPVTVGRNGHLQLGSQISCSPSGPGSLGTVLCASLALWGAMGPKDWGRTARGVQNGGRVKFTVFLISRASFSVYSSNVKEEIPNERRKRSEEVHTRGFAARQNHT